MRRHLPIVCGLVLVVFLTAVSSPSAAPRSLARYAAADKDRVILENGRGVALFRVRGGLWGYFGRGAVRITDLPRGRETEISVDGEEHVRRVNDRTVVYSGRAVSFYILGGWWRARIQGRGIDVGAQLHGYMALVGRAGIYKLRDDDEEHKWPRKRRVFQLG